MQCQPIHELSCCCGGGVGSLLNRANLIPGPMFYREPWCQEVGIKHRKSDEDTTKEKGFEHPNLPQNHDLHFPPTKNNPKQQKKSDK